MNTIVLATFSQPGAGRAAVEDLLDAGFINLAQEQDGEDVLVTVDAGARATEARAIVARYGGIELDQP
jgi:hypothetical protein